jgi:hypothetical protein
LPASGSFKCFVGNCVGEHLFISQLDTGSGSSAAVIVHEFRSFTSEAAATHLRAQIHLIVAFQTSIDLDQPRVAKIAAWLRAALAPISLT